MGGPGSSRWGPYYVRKTPVEECWLLDIKKLKGALRELPQASSGTCRAVKISAERLKKIHFEVDPKGEANGEPLVVLTYRLGKDYSGGGLLAELASAYLRDEPFSPRIEEPVELTSTPCHFGGVRWWFRCPLVREDGGVCDRRVAKLWFPPGQRFFGCSECHNLTHRSSLECHDLDFFATALGKYAPDTETKELLKQELKAMVSKKKVENRRRKENMKSPLELFDEYLGEI